MTSNQPSEVVSVVIPTHNRPDLVTRTVGSVLAQRGVEVDVVVVDDGSMPPLPLPADDRVRVFRHEVAKGVAAARNRGIEEAQGAWIAFLDDDDLWSPDKLRSQLLAMRQLGRVWAVTGVISVDPDLRPVAGAPPGSPSVDEIHLRNVVPGGASNVIAKAELVKAARGFDSELRHMADWDMWIQLCEHGPPAVVAEPHVAYVQHGANASLDVETIAQEIPVIESRFGRRVDRPYVYRWIAWGQLRLGRRRAAAAWYLRAIREGDYRSALRLGAAVLGGGRVAEAANRPDDTWSAAAEPWLRELREEAA